MDTLGAQREFNVRRSSHLSLSWNGGERFECGNDLASFRGPAVVCLSIPGSPINCTKGILDGYRVSLRLASYEVILAGQRIFYFFSIPAIASAFHCSWRSERYRLS